GWAGSRQRTGQSVCEGRQRGGEGGPDREGAGAERGPESQAHRPVYEGAGGGAAAGRAQALAEALARSPDGGAFVEVQSCALTQGDGVAISVTEPMSRLGCTGITAVPRVQDARAFSTASRFLAITARY